MLGAPRTPWNYLRMRGEYLKTCLALGLSMELPPHARRIRVAGLNTTAENGTTSACAENTDCSGLEAVDPGNYLRVRGEYLLMGGVGSGEVELPPHARRIHHGRHTRPATRGTTSACAGNTIRRAGIKELIGNYLRMRGEYFGHYMTRHHKPELPPRARRIQNEHYYRGLQERTTSACAENTVLQILGTTQQGNYLRVRGEYAKTRETPS